MTIEYFSYIGNVPGTNSYVYYPTINIANASYSGAAGLEQGSNGFGFVLPVDGSYVTFMQTNSTSPGAASYTFGGLTAGQTYTLEFYAARTPANTNDSGGGFTLNGTAYAAPPTTQWTEETYTFTATGTNETFAFAIDNIGGHTVGIDNMMLVQGAVDPFNFTGQVPTYGGFIYTPSDPNASFVGKAGLELAQPNFNFVTPPDNSYILFMQTSNGNGTAGSAGLTFNGLTAGQTYTIDFNAAAGPVGSPTNYSVNGTSYATPSATAWTAETYSFTATGSSETVSFAVTDTAGDHTVGINAVTLVICFAAGTKIATPEGERAVETLQRGDLVQTLGGRAMPVTWLGRQTVSTRFANPQRVLPIRIRAGALGDNVPCRDLLVSPDHALLVDDVLIQAAALVNGTSIERETNVPETFVYYHVEVDDHSLIFAENTPAETFVDNVDRLHFDNWAEHEAFYPNGKVINELPHPRAKSYRQVPLHIRESLAERALAIGCTSMMAVA